MKLEGTDVGSEDATKPLVPNLNCLNLTTYHMIEFDEGDTIEINALYCCNDNIENISMTGNSFHYFHAVEISRLNGTAKRMVRSLCV